MSTTATAAKVGASHESTPNKSPRSSIVAAKEQAKHNAIPTRRALPEYQRIDRPALCSERHPHTELAHSPAHRIGDHAVKPDNPKKIGTHEASNRFLQEEYLADHNRRFARETGRAAGLSLQGAEPRASWSRCFVWRLAGAFRTTEWCVMGIAIFKLERHSDYPPRQAKVTVCEWEDQRIEIRYQGEARPYREIAAPERRKSVGSRRPAILGGGPGIGDAADRCLRFALNTRPGRLAGLRSGSGPQHGKELVTKEKRGHF